jgi:hypothetical protein
MTVAFAKARGTVVPHRIDVDARLIKRLSLKQQQRL